MTEHSPVPNPTVPSNSQVEQAPTEDEYRLWAKYEDIAMHFNDLIMRWRLQAIGGLVTLVMFAGTVINDVESLQMRYRGMVLLSGTLLSAWIGLAVMDLFYYRHLLSGAVKELLRLEKRVGVRLSSVIERHARCGACWTPWVFYILGGLPLLGLIWYATCQLVHLPADPLAL